MKLPSSRPAQFAAALACVSLLGTASIRAATITVNDAGDAAADDGVCTLREAIIAANTNAASGASASECTAGVVGPDTIAFNIPGAGVHTITPLSALPTIAEQITIDGYTQPGAVPNTLSGAAYPNAQGLDTQIRIEIDGTSAGAVDGLSLSGGGASGSAIRGLAIVNFSDYNRAAIRTSSSASYVHVAGNFIGIRADGATVGANGYGANIGTPWNMIGTGGSPPAGDRNLIAGNLNCDLGLNGANSTGVVGNLIGTDATGTLAKSPNGGICAGSVMTVAVEDNVISGHGTYGLLLSGIQNSALTGNAIGIAVGGGALGNGFAGIALYNGSSFTSQNNQIFGNGIANNGISGIDVGENADGAPSGILISNNVIYTNGGLGINLRPTAEAISTPTPNDAQDSDAGPNSLQNSPLITSAVVNGSGGVDIAFTLNSTPNTQFNVAAYSNDTCDASGYGEGQYVSGIIDTPVTTDANGDASGMMTIPAPLPGGWAVGQHVALLTSKVSPAATSEFSPCAQVAASSGAPPVMGDVPDQIATVGTPFSLALAGYVTLTGNPIVAGGYAIATGTLPPGLSLDADTGVISGTPTTAGIYDENITVTASDTDGASNADAIQFTVNAAVNSPPVAGGDIYNTPFDTALNVATPGVLANDSDPDGNPITAVLSIGPNHGALSLDAAGGFTYTPTAGYSGMDSFAYVANDGTANSAQVAWVILYVGASPVTSYTGPIATATGNAKASFSGGGVGCTYTKSVFIPLSGGAGSPPPGSEPAGYVFPFGLFDFAVGNCTPGSTIVMTISYPQAVPAGAVYWKYGPTAGEPTPHWYQLPASIAGNTATFSIADGGLGDDDLTANGVIVDQGGPGAPDAPGGVAAIPTLSQWGMALLAGLLVLMGMPLARRRGN